MIRRLGINGERQLEPKFFEPRVERGSRGSGAMVWLILEFSGGGETGCSRAGGSCLCENGAAKHSNKKRASEVVKDPPVRSLFQIMILF